MNKIINIAIITLLILSSTTLIHNNRETKEKEQELKCYRYLYNNDEILTDCNKYFEKDSWYKEYKSENTGLLKV